MENFPNRRALNRIRISTPKKIWINQKECLLINISREGIGVLITVGQIFFIGQRIDDILLAREAETFSLKGIVSHMTENESGTICGIRFEFQNGRDFDYVQKISHEFKSVPAK